MKGYIQEHIFTGTRVRREMAKAGATQEGHNMFCPYWEGGYA
jgi:hypothetical protein